MSGLREIPVKDVLTVDVPKGASKFGDTADQIWLYNTTTMDWVKYYYKSGRSGAVGWVNAAVDGNTETTDTMKNGDGFFFRRSGAAVGNITISGALKATDADPISLTANRLHFVCNPWPVSFKINSIGIDVPKGASKFGDTADQVWLYDTTTMDWVKYYYKSGRSGAVGWVNAAVDGATPTEDSIGVGQGFFLRRSGAAAGNLIWVKPAGL